MSKFFKTFTLLLSMVMVFGVFAACGGEKKPDDNPGDNYEVNIDFNDEQYNQTAELTVGVTSDKYEEELIKAVAADFKNIFPNVTIKPVQISGDYISQIEQRVKTNNVPDIFFTSEKEAFSFVSADLFLNLAPYINAENLAADSVAENKGFESQFVPEAWKIGQENYGGDQFFIPRSSDRIVTHLNTNHINAAITAWNASATADKKLATDIVKNGWTWDDFLKVCEALRVYYNSKGWTAAGDRYIVDGSFGWEPVMFSVFESNKAVLANGNNFVFDSKGTTDSANMIRNLVEKQYIGPKGKGANYENKQGAMLFHSSSAIAKYKGYIGEDYDIVTFPLINGDSSVFGYGVPGYGIYSGIKEEKRDLAWQFLDYILSKDGQETMAGAGMCTPSVRQNLQDYNTAKWGEGYRDLNLAATTYLPQKNYTEDFFLAFPSKKKNAMVSAIGSFMGDITAYSSGKFQLTVEKCVQNCITTVTKELNKI